MGLTIKKKVEHFQNLLVNAESFSDSLNYFLDEIATDDSFMDGCQPLNNDNVIAVLLAVAESIHANAGGNEKDKAEAQVLQMNKKYKFAHGTCRIGKNMAILAYLRELDMGVAGLPSQADPSMVIFARFTGHGVEMPAGAIPAFDRSGYKH
ncbi:hypothetical protein [Thiorhodovibrio frisius]|uniref:Uncharacterized protein n=1 Tax=Thiorhodovibrio frisius TaxID=631362 RepID=H8Z2W1_9GAMM|nr:hypothetical protein [Thiorhodovibrio frisius]EIC21697.1 hypothetical protein Thi970DRAFT_01920 [Thiorhodovibrio frisius]WPL21665.1 hypothetical protein Thiofri_01793 [Thiorhodovibrio frisius]